DYTPYMPVIGHHCAGTHHQTIGPVQRVVFLGDSVTRGTPPARLWEWYRAILTERLVALHGEDLVVDDCSAFGARTDDLLIGKRQIPQCFPDDGDDRATLVIFTVGGNDIAKWAQDKLGADEAMQAAEEASDLLDDALAWFREPGRFPNGVSVVFANPYEYTDGTGDLASCELSAVAELDGNWIEGAPAVLYFQERFMRAAVTYGFDLVFSLEHFCGHGFHHDDPASQCYLGPDAELWFDFTCIHPNTRGHLALADLFWATITDAPPEDAP
ncbi:MAG: SGNH/GDSL hydrolase family protein, partial [Myxococcales bacterium]|nr:SGNH/GDSL hydrolase family protein [Myxococcales bacterium]